MILPMSKVRILGPRALLSDVLPVLQDFGQLHLSPPKEAAGLSIGRRDAKDQRRARQLARIRRAATSALQALGGPPRQRPRQVPSPPDRDVLAGWARAARSANRQANALRDRRKVLEEERAFLARYWQFFGTFQDLAAAAAKWPGAAIYHVVLPKGGERPLARLRAGLREMLGEEFEIWSKQIDTGETGVLILVPGTSSERLEKLFAAERVEEVQLPGSAEGLGPADAIPRIMERYDTVLEELRSLEMSMAKLAKQHGPTLEGALAALEDELARHDAVERTAATAHAFVLEGWTPSSQIPALRSALQKTVGEATIVEEVEREEWRGENVPVVLKNPRLFRPFEVILRILPLPRYGSIDPTPFLAIFFPMFFGLVLGDVGYGLLLAAVALVLRRRSPVGSTRRAVAEIAGACSAFAVIFGFLFGELFGDAGTRLFGMDALAFHREEALLPFLGLALAIGVVHMLLGLVLNLVAKLRLGPRAAIGPGAMLLMVALVILAILAAADVLPGAFFTPAVLAVLVLFPVLVVVEGILGATEFVSTVGHILSYARVMAVGTASVMMAVAANRMIGTMGSVLVGSIFALLFHLVNFALGIFSPTVHALRLHFVEFFGTFYSPGGTRYEPFGHWAPSQEPQPKRQ
jgi:V/A-type H+-transporting ATPase subunit I